MIGASTIIWLAIALAGLIGSALFSGLETGTYCLNRVRLMVLSLGAGRDKRHTRARLIRRELDRPEQLLTTLLITNNVTNYMGAIGVSALLAQAGLSDWALVAINAAVLTPFLFVFGETLPKDLFRADADRLTYRWAPALVIARRALTIAPLMPLINWLAKFVASRIGADERDGLTGARGRMVALVKEGAKYGVLSESQMTLIDRALAFGELTVRAEMTPWSRAVAVGADWSPQRIAQAFQSHAISRLPVVDRRGRVVGEIDARDYWDSPKGSVTQLMRPPLSVSPEMRAAEALLTLRSAGRKLAIVEHRGRPVGLVTIKDLIEPVTGELRAW